MTPIRPARSVRHHIGADEPSLSCRPRCCSALVAD
jgi:hypothetical protein